MKRKMALFMALLALIILPAGTLTVTRMCFSLTMERERTRALSEEAAIARAVAMEISSGKEQNLVSVASGMQGKYGSSSLGVYLLYNGRAMAGGQIPDAPNLETLIASEGRATLLDGQSKTLFISHRLTPAVSLLLSSDVSEVYQFKSTLQKASAVICTAGAFAAALCAFLISGAVLKPLSLLTRAAEKMEKGDYSAEVPSALRDETGILANAFINMKEAVIKREERLVSEAEGRQELINALSHEMRTPLTAILSGAELLKTAKLTEDEKTGILEMISGEGKRLSKMDETLMLLTRLSDREIEKTAFSGLQAAVEAAGVFEGVCVSGDETDFTGDRELMIILIRNLIVNALRAGGTEDVKVEVHQSGFSVTDNGCGMTEEEIERAFEPFYKADKSRTRKNGGAGLGLTISKKIADLHGGSITIESKKGRGTRVVYNPDTTG